MAARTHPEIKSVEIPTEEKFLRKKTEAFDFGKHGQKEINELVRNMRKIMREANGIGLAANQIGLPWRVFVAEIQGEEGPKFYALFNPKLEKMGREKEGAEEGCLSVPLTYGDVPRAVKLILLGQDKNGKNVKIKAWGLLARVFQHEVDHLDGHLFIDRATRVYTVEEQRPSKSRG